MLSWYRLCAFPKQKQRKELKKRRAGSHSLNMKKMKKKKMPKCFIREIVEKKRHSHAS